MNSNKKEKAICLDIGGTNLRAAIIKKNLVIEKIIIQNTIKDNKEAFIDQVISIIENLDFNEKEIKSIVIGVPGRVRNNGFIDELPNIHVKDINLKDAVEKAFNIKTIIKNDAQIAGYAEAVAGAGKHFDSMYFITVSTGFGGALFYKKEFKNSSDEIGHTIFKYKDHFYEFEQIASGSGLLFLGKLNGLHFSSTKEIFEKYKTNDIKTVNLIKDWLELLHDFLAFVSETFEPEIFVFTGGVMNSKEYFFKELKEMNKSLLLKECYFSQNAGLIGACLMAFKQ